MPSRMTGRPNAAPRKHPGRALRPAFPLAPGWETNGRAIPGLRRPMSQCGPVCLLRRVGGLLARALLLLSGNGCRIGSNRMFDRI